MVVDFIYPHDKKETHAYIALSVVSDLRTLKKMIWETIAPSFPLAAAIPCPVERYRVGKISPGMMKVVTFGPKLVKKFAKQYNAKKASVLDS